jgi:hypothetical protein
MPKTKENKRYQLTILADGGLQESKSHLTNIGSLRIATVQKSKIEITLHPSTVLELC